MKTHPLTLTDWQVKAVLDGRLRQHREVLPEQPGKGISAVKAGTWQWRSKNDHFIGFIKLPYAPGDKLDVNNGEALAIIRAVRIERLHEMSEEEAEAEGAGPSRLVDGDPPFEESAKILSCLTQYRDHWNATHDPGEQFEDNPWAIVRELEKETTDD